MRVLLVGKGGREHALAYKLSRSPLLTKLYLWPGSPVMTPYGETLDLAPPGGSETFAKAVTLAQQLAIDLVVSGPEAPLSEGLADVFQAAGIPTFGPVRAAAMLESSKEFAKHIMVKAGIPTASFKVTKDEASCRAEALRGLEHEGGTVLKASGLAAGKGVFVCSTAAEIEEGLRHLFHTDMRAAADTVVVESVLKGRECSYFSFIGSKGSQGIGFAVDHKRLNDGDQGPNTGGMGCYAPVSWLPRNAETEVQRKVLEPLMKTLKAEGVTYQGCLYVGLMWSPERGPQVVEFNVRLGDPEAQVLAAYDDRDWLAVMAGVCGLAVPGEMYRRATSPFPAGEAAVAVVMTSKSYPFGKEPPEKAPLPLSLFAGNEPAVKVFGSSLVQERPGLLATGSGRVLTVTARAATFQAARSLAYKRVEEIGSRWPGAHWRRDIGLNIETIESIEMKGRGL